jgi:hypothetical protein
MKYTLWYKSNRAGIRTHDLLFLRRTVDHYATSFDTFFLASMHPNCKQMIRTHMYTYIGIDQGCHMDWKMMIYVHILWTFGISYVFWYILCSFGTFLRLWVSRTKKNAATLVWIAIPLKKMFRCGYVHSGMYIHTYFEQKPEKLSLYLYMHTSMLELTQSDISANNAGVKFVTNVCKETLYEFNCRLD